MGKCHTGRPGHLELRPLGRAALILAFLFNLCLLPVTLRPIPASAATEPAGIQQADPHDAALCMRCHMLDDQHRTFGESPINYDVDDVCLGCHETFSMHPVGIPLAEGMGKRSPVPLPLVRKESQELVSCLTCHFFHGMQSRRYLLRNEGVASAGRMGGLCGICHLEAELMEMSPHSGVDTRCGICHWDIPAQGQEFSLEEYARFQRRCDFCHGLVAEDHYRSIDPLSDPELSHNDRGLELVHLEGEYACFSCHDPHDDQEWGRKLLKEEYLELAAVSRLVNPHWKNVMCVTCHEGKPGKGESHLRMEGDVNGLCVRCHDNDIAPGFLHPVGCEPSDRVTIPEEFPLSDGLITCQTCHQSSLQETGEDVGILLRGNSSFLRRDDLSPAEFCFQCHRPEVFSRTNVHDQIDEKGDVRTEMCSGCHFVLPEDDGDPALTAGWETDPKEFCLLCHKREIYLSNHPAGPHIVEPSRDIYYMILSAEDRIGASLPLFEDRITCSTCHDSHEMGVLKSHSRVEVRTGNKGVRAQYRELLCTACHGGAE